MEKSSTSICGWPKSVRLANLPQSLYEYRQNFTSVCFTRGHELRSKQDAAIREALVRQGLDPDPLPNVRRSFPSRPPMPSELPGPTAPWSRAIETPRVITRSRLSAQRRSGIGNYRSGSGSAFNRCSGSAADSGCRNGSGDRVSARGDRFQVLRSERLVQSIHLPIEYFTSSRIR